MKIVAADLDGTLLPANGKVSREDIDTLKMLGNRGVVRVIATGRSFRALLQSIPRSFPIDYLVFSTGAGIMNWKTGEIIYSSKIPSDRVRYLIEHLNGHNLDFMLHKPVPDTHEFYYYGTEFPNSDFYDRMKHYPDYCIPLEKNHYPESCQVLAFIPNSYERFLEVTKGLDEFKVIRETSPLNRDNMWVEIFDKNVSKGHALEHLAEMLGVSPANTMSIGNDFNDLDMLNFTSQSFVVENAPDDLKRLHRVVPSALNSGFSQAVKLFFNNV